jgi:hypothetical protein
LRWEIDKEMDTERFITKQINIREQKTNSIFMEEINKIVRKFH